MLIQGEETTKSKGKRVLEDESLLLLIRSGENEEIKEDCKRTFIAPLPPSEIGVIVLCSSIVLHQPEEFSVNECVHS